MQLRSNTLAHEVLKVLELGEFQPSEIDARLQGRFTRETLLGLPGVLAELEFVGLVLVSDGKVSSTAEGNKECARLNHKAQEIERAKQVKANLVHIPKDTYDGAELRKQAVRPGALDYLKCPSVFNGKRSNE